MLQIDDNVDLSMAPSDQNKRIFYVKKKVQVFTLLKENVSHFWIVRRGVKVDILFDYFTEPFFALSRTVKTFAGTFQLSRAVKIFCNLISQNF